MRKLVVFIASLGLLAALVPALAWARPGAIGGETATPVAKVDPHLDDLLATSEPRDELVVFVHADDIDRAVSAAAAVGLTLVDTFDRIGVAVAAGDPAAVAAVSGQPGVFYVEADRSITFGMQTSHIATRGADARTAFQEPVDGEDDPDERKTGLDRAGERAGERGAHGRDRTQAGNGASTSAAPGEPLFADEIDGRGVTIAVIDTGIDGTHPMFQVDDDTSKVVRNLKLACPTGMILVSFEDPQDPDRTHGTQEVCLSTSAGGYSDLPREAWVDVTGASNDTDTFSLSGHGTHVAGTAAGVDVVTADGRELHGAAPGAHLVGLGIGLSRSMYGGAAAMDWILTHHRAPCGPDVDAESCPPIRVVNNSYGPLGGGEYNPRSVTSRLQELLVAEGVVVVWANGNDGGDGADNNSNPAAQSPTPGIIGVANYNDANRGTRSGGLAPSSSRGERGRPQTYPDVSAPGTAITSACRTRLVDCNTLDQDQDYGTITGTSMAAPHVAGIAAQLLQVRPELTPAEVEYVLEVTAHKFGDPATYERDESSGEPGVFNPDSRTSFDKGHGLVDVVAAVAHLLDSDAPLAPAECVPDGPVVVDDEGDATSFIGFETPLPSESSLDIVEGRLDWDAGAETLTFEIEVLDLAETNPPGTTGVAFDFFFTHDGASYYLLAGRSDTDARGERFVLGRIETTRETLVPDLPGSFDADSDTITIHVPNAVLGDIDEDVHVPPFADGDVLEGFEIVSRREFGVAGAGFIPDADSAGGVCPYTIGLGAVAPPPASDDDEDPADPDEPVEELDPPEEADHAVGPSWPDVAWEGFTVSPTNGLVPGPEPCRQVVPDGGCADTTWLFVTAPGEVTITVSGMLPGDDWDVYVYDEDGNQVAVGGEFGDEDFTTALPSGLYEVVVTPWLAPSGEYSATASWSG